MRKKILAALLVFALFWPAFSQRPVSRDDVLRHAFANSEELARIGAERDRIVHMRREYYGRAFPDINAALNYVFAPNLNKDPASMPSTSSFLEGDENDDFFLNDQILAGALDGAMGGISEALASMNAKNTLQWEISATQPIFVQGKVKTGLRIADIALTTTDLQYLDEQFNLAQAITDAYNSALLAQQNKIIQQDALSIAEESHRLALANFRSGRGNVLDTLNTKFAHQQAILRLREAEMGERLAIKALANTASLDDDDLLLLDSLSVPEFYMDEATAWEKMQENNLTLRILDKAQSLQEEQTNLARSDYLPLIAAFANIGQVNLFNDGDGFRDGWTWRTQLGVGIQVPIWNGGQRRSRMHQARIEEYKLEKQETQAKNGLRLALSAAFENLAVARQELAQVEQMLVLAEQGFRISKVAFELGQLTQLELNNNEQNHRLAKLAHNNAVFKINSAVVNIERLIGSENLISVGN